MAAACIPLDAVWPDQSIAPMSVTTLDLRGLRCPLPALKTRKALTRLADGDPIVGPGPPDQSQIRILNLINQTGDVLEASENQTGVFVFRIRKASPATCSKAPRTKRACSYSA